MYANLRVSLANGEQMFAWKVEVGASTVVVHVDDARSTKCTMIDGAGADATTIDKRTAVLWCRERLVVESVQTMGPDPSFPAF